MLKTIRKPFLLLALPVLLMACDERRSSEADLIVITRNAPTTVYEGRDGPAGPEHDLIMSFAEHQQLSVEFVVKDSIKDIFESIARGEGDIAAAGLTRTEAREASGVNFGPDYFEVQQQVVCRRNHGGIPKSPQELAGRNIVIIAASSYEESMQEMQQTHPEIQWTSVANEDTEKLLEDVWQKKIDCTLADSNIVSINRRYYPELVVAFAATERQSLAWVLSPDASHLSPKIEAWLEAAGASGELAQIKDRYYGHVEIFDYVDMSKYQRRIEKLLPKYRETFEEIAARHNLPWTLIAAQAYQESHWNPKAKSPTGVRGMMMLTQRTAGSVGVKNRLDPKQSIEGGVKYLEKMLARLPDEVQGVDRLWFALAAYNVGMGHLRDARTLAVRLERNPNLWVDLQEVLPLLSKKEYYKTLQYGYARGTEPVNYVNRIRSYRQVLERYLKSQEDISVRDSVASAGDTGTASSDKAGTSGSEDGQSKK